MKRSTLVVVKVCACAACGAEAGQPCTYLTAGLRGQAMAFCHWARSTAYGRQAKTVADNLREARL